MKRKRFSEEQIIRILHEAESLDNVREVCRQHNSAEQTLYRWRMHFGGMAVSKAKRLRTLEQENAALKLICPLIKRPVDVLGLIHIDRR